MYFNCIKEQYLGTYPPYPVYDFDCYNFRVLSDWICPNFKKSTR